MADILQRLNQIPERLSDKAFLNNQGLSNEVGIHVLCYDPKDEITVRHFLTSYSKGMPPIG